MSVQTSKKFKDKEDIKSFLESVSAKVGIQRDKLADKLGISQSAFYGYITRREIPYKSYVKLTQMLDGKFQDDIVSTRDIEMPAHVELKNVSLDDLLKEIEKRGWIVEMKRNINNKQF